MVSPRAIRRFVRWPWAAGLSTLVLISAVSCSSTVTPPASNSVAAGSDFAVPDGTPGEINAFVQKLKQRKLNFKDQKEAMAFAVNAQKAFITAGDKILNQECSAEVAVKAAQMKMSAFFMLAEGRIEDYSNRIVDEVTRLKQDRRPEIAQFGDQLWIPARITNSPNMGVEDRKKLSEELFTAMVQANYSDETVGPVVQLGNTLGDAGKGDEAGAILERLAKIASESTNKKLKANAEVFQSTARKLRLPGNKFELTGKTLSGEKIDWESYRGKVVLIDYWATWCKPCLQELPNVKANYAKYHDRGFEVIGISLDSSRETLQEFVDAEKIPWPQVFDDSKDMGWGHPMARYYGISSVPTAILVDKDGKVVSMSARAEELAELLEKLLGKAD